MSCCRDDGLFFLGCRLGAEIVEHSGYMVLVVYVLVI